MQFSSCLLFSFRKIALKGVATVSHGLMGIWYYSQASKAKSNIQSLNMYNFKDYKLGILQDFGEK